MSNDDAEDERPTPRAPTMQRRTPPAGMPAHVQSDDSRARRMMEEIRQRQTAVVKHELSELEGYTPPPTEMPEDAQQHWTNINNRVLETQQRVITSDWAAIVRELEKLRNENLEFQHKNETLHNKVNILWKVMIAVAMAVLGGLGASYNAVHNSGELQGSTAAQIESNRRDIDRHEQTLNYLLETTASHLPRFTPPQGE